MTDKENKPEDTSNEYKEIKDLSEEELKQHMKRFYREIAESPAPPEPKIRRY